MTNRNLHHPILRQMLAEELLALRKARKRIRLDSSTYRSSAMLIRSVYARFGLKSDRGQLTLR